MTGFSLRRNGFDSAGQVTSYSVNGSEALAGGQLIVNLNVVWDASVRGCHLLDGTLQLRHQSPHVVGPALRLTLPVDQHLWANGHPQQVVFEGSLSYAELEHLEKLRNGQDLQLQAEMRLQAARFNKADQETNKSYPLIERLERWAATEPLQISSRNWITVLERMHFRHSLFIDMMFPFNPDEPTPLSRKLVSARKAFDAGNYQDAVSDLRQVLEALENREADRDLKDEANKKYRGNGDSRTSMSWAERLLAIRSAIYHAGNMTHHPTDVDVHRAACKALFVMVAALLELYPTTAMAPFSSSSEPGPHGA